MHLGFLHLDVLSRPSESSSASTAAMAEGLPANSSTTVFMALAVVSYPDI